VSKIINSLNTEIKRKSDKLAQRTLMPKVKKIKNLDGAIRYASGLDEIQVNTNFNVPTFGGANRLIGTQLDRLNIQTQSIIGNNTDGEVFGGFAKSIGNTGGEVGLVKFVSTAGLDNVVTPNFKVYASGAPQAISIASKDIEKKINAQKVEINTFLDSLPQVLGRPSGGFLGSILKVAGIAGGLNGLLQQISPLANISNQLNNIKDQVLDQTGISGFLDQVNGLADNVTNYVNTSLDAVSTSLGEAIGNPLSELDNALSINIGEETFSTNLGGFANDLLESVTGDLRSRTNNFISGAIPDVEIGGLVSGIVSDDITERVSSIGRITQYDNVVRENLTLFEPWSAVENASSPRDAIFQIETNGKKNGASAANISYVQGLYASIISKTENNTFNAGLSSVIAIGSSPLLSVNPLPLSKKFTYVSSIEELELEISSRLVVSAARGVSSVVIHATETFTNKNIGAEEIDAIQKKLGEDEIGYHYVIRRDGRLQRGRPVEKEGSHCPTGNYDKTSIGIVMVGGINRASTEQSFETSSASFTRAQYNTLEQFLQVFYNNFSGGEVFGHSDIETDELDPYFDVSEYILSLFGKINSSSLGVPEIEGDFEPTAPEGITEETGTNAPTTRVQVTPEELNVAPDEVPKDVEVVVDNESKFKVIYEPQEKNYDLPVDPDALLDDIPEKLQKLANYMKRDIRVTSGYRDEEHNRRAGGAKFSPHLSRKAVDISRSDRAPTVGGWRYTSSLMSDAQVADLVQKASELGFKGIGIYNNYLHLDTRSGKKCWATPKILRVSSIPRFAQIATVLRNNDWDNV
jgi:N-acetylmuramoyl-L-alanine amidase